MSYRRLCATSVQALLVICGSAHAAGPISPNSDVLGIRLAMSRDEARKVIEQTHPGAPIFEIPVGLAVGGFEKKATAGFVADLATKADNAANLRKAEQEQANLNARKAAGFGDSPLNRTVGSVGDFAQDRVMVLFDPNDNATDIFGVSRYTEYAAGSQPTTKTFVEALVEKYGTPSRSGGDRHILLTYTWAAPGVLERTQRAVTHCYEENGFDFLYEGVGDTGYYGMRQLLATIGGAFVGSVNLIHSKNPLRNYSICGTILQVRLKLAKDGDYVGAMSARLLDLSKAYTELGEFADSVWNHAAALRQEQLNSGSAVKPRL
jgi:hypothetical protein